MIALFAMYSHGKPPNTIISWVRVRQDSKVPNQCSTVCRFETALEPLRKLDIDEEGDGKASKR